MLLRRLATAVFSLVLAVALASTPAAAARHDKKDKKPKEKKPAAAASIQPMPDDQQAEHVLNRLGYGARPGDIERVRALGVHRYIEQQLHPEKIDDRSLEARLEPLETLRLSNSEIALGFPPLNEVRQLIKAAKAGQPLPPRIQNLYDRLTKQFPQILTVDDPQKLQESLTLEQRRYLQMHSPQRVILELQQAKLMRAVHSERQLQEQMVDFWMNHFNVFANKGADRWLLTSYERDAIRPNALGKFRDLLLATAHSPAMLFYLDNFQSVAPNPNAPDAARKRGLNENYARELMELHTLGVDGGYTQHDVTEVARCLTGWSIKRPRDGAEFSFNPRQHDNGEKVVLGVTIPAGGGEEDGLKVLDMLARHPSTARFIATKLVRRFVSDIPPPALVARAAETFRQTDGDIREVLRTILTSPEFLSREAYRAKVKTPFEMVASALRASGADIGTWPPLVQAVARLGEPLYMCEPPTGYPDVAEAWINTGLMLNRVNFAYALASGYLPNVRVHPDEIQVTNLGEKTRTAMETETDPANLGALLLGSPEFQRR